MRKGDFDAMAGTYSYSLNERVNAGAVLLGQVLAICWFYFNGDSNGMSLSEAVLAVAVVVGGVVWILRSILRKVVVGSGYVLAHSLFGLFCQRIRLEKVESIRFGGMSRGVRIDFNVEGKVVRLAGNRRFLRALVDTMRGKPTVSGGVT